MVYLDPQNFQSTETEGKMASVYGYARVSTEGQTEGVSLDAQQARIAAWCKSNGHQLVRVEVDAGKSGKRADNRPALQRALAAVTKDRGILCVYSLSRLARSTRDALDIADRLAKSGADLVSLTESIDTSSPMGKMFFTMMSALAELERSMISQRTKCALDHKRRHGQRVSRFPAYGYRFEGDAVVPVPAEQALISRIRAMKADGYAVMRIADILNAEGVRTPQGKSWHPTSVHRILARAV